MNPDYIFDLSWGNRQPVEGAQYRRDVNALEDQHLPDTRHEVNEYQRFLRQRDHSPTWDDWGFAGYDPALENSVTGRVEEEPGVLQYYSTSIDNGHFHRFSTPLTTPEPHSRTPVVHNIAPPHPDLLSIIGRFSDDVWYSEAFYNEPQTLVMVPPRNTMHPLEKALTCNNVARTNEEILEYPLAPFDNECIREVINVARYEAKRYIGTVQELEHLHNAALRNESEEDAWMSLRSKCIDYPKSRIAVAQKYTEI